MRAALAAFEQSPLFVAYDSRYDRQLRGEAVLMADEELGRMLMDVCCLLKGIEAAEAGQGLPRRSGKVVLQLALTALARHYGLLAPPVPPRDVTHILHWGQADYRPSLGDHDSA